MTPARPGRRAGPAGTRVARRARREATPARTAVRIAVPAARLPWTAARLDALVGRAARLAEYPGRLSVAVVDDPAMRALNRDFHGCDEPTDVLAFPLGRPEGVPAGEGFDGEVVVSLDTARVEAAARGVSLSSEVLLYVVHGVLHLLGEDDHDPAAYRRMHERALSILAALGETNTIDPPHAKLGGPGKARTR